MMALQRLWLSLNDITMLPPELCFLTNLYDLRLDGAHAPGIASARPRACTRWHVPYCPVLARGCVGLAYLRGIKAAIMKSRNGPS